MLIDAGIGPRVAAARLCGTGVRVADFRALCLTHLDADHFSPAWTQTLVRYGIEVFCHYGCVDRLREMVADPSIEPLLRPFGNTAFEPLPGVTARPLALAHDCEGSHGFLIESGGRRLGYATDLGFVPAALVDAFVDLDVLALESNYDPAMQEQSPRPWFLKQRIMGGRGHLSNRQAYEGIRRMLDRAERNACSFPTHIVLLHRSQQCNCPRLVRELFSADPRIATRLVLAEPFSRTQWLSAPGRPIAAGEQLLLAWG